MAVVALRVDPGTAARAMVEAPWWVFVLPPMLLLINSGLHGMRVWLLLRSAGHQVSLWGVVAALLKASFVGVALPTGGSEVAKAAFLLPHVGRTAPVLAALLTARVLELIPWGLLLVYGLLWGLPARFPPLALAATGFALVFLAVLICSALLVREGSSSVGRWWADVLKRRRGAGVGAGFLDACRAMGRDWATIRMVTLLAFPFALINGLVVWVVLAAYGIDISYPEVLAVIPAADTLISLPITISGLGVREGIFVYVLAPWGADEAVAVAAGFTRWTGELGRALAGGLLLVVGAGGPSGSYSQE